MRASYVEAFLEAHPGVTVRVAVAPAGLPRFEARAFSGTWRVCHGDRLSLALERLFRALDPKWTAANPPPPESE